MAKIKNKMQRTKLKKINKSLKEANISVNMLLDDVHFVSHGYYIKTELDILKKKLHTIETLIN